MVSDRLISREIEHNREKRVLLRKYMREEEEEEEEEKKYSKHGQGRIGL